MDDVITENTSKVSGGINISSQPLDVLSEAFLHLGKLTNVNTSQIWYRDIVVAHKPRRMMKRAIETQGIAS